MLSSYSFLKDIFAGYRIPNWQSFSFNNWKISLFSGLHASPWEVHCYLNCFSCIDKILFLSRCFEIVFVLFCFCSFKNFDYDVSCGFLWVLSCLEFCQILEYVILLLLPNSRLFQPLFFKYVFILMLYPLLPRVLLMRGRSSVICNPVGPWRFLIFLSSLFSLSCLHWIISLILSLVYSLFSLPLPSYWQTLLLIIIIIIIIIF